MNDLFFLCSIVFPLILFFVCLPWGLVARFVTSPSRYPFYLTREVKIHQTNWSYPLKTHTPCELLCPYLATALSHTSHNGGLSSPFAVCRLWYRSGSRFPVRPWDDDHDLGAQTLQQRSPNQRDVFHRWTYCQIRSGRICGRIILDMGGYTASVVRGGLQIWRLWSFLVCFRRNGTDFTLCNAGYRTEATCTQRTYLLGSHPG